MMMGGEDMVRYSQAIMWLSLVVLHVLAVTFVHAQTLSLRTPNSFIPNGALSARSLLVLAPDMIFVGTTNITWWNDTSQSAVKTFSVSSNVRKLGYANGILYSISADKLLRAWNLTSGLAIATVSYPLGTASQSAGSLAIDNGIAYLGGTMGLAALSLTDYSTVFWYNSTQIGSVWSVVSDGFNIYAGTSQKNIYKVHPFTGAITMTFPGFTDPANIFTNMTHLFSIPGDSRIFLYDTSTAMNTRNYTLTYPSSTINLMSIYSCGGIIYTGTDDDTLFGVDDNTGSQFQRINSLAGGTYIMNAIARIGTLVYTADSAGKVFRLTGADPNCVVPRNTTSGASSTSSAMSSTSSIWPSTSSSATSSSATTTPSQTASSSQNAVASSSSQMASSSSSLATSSVAYMTSTMSSSSSASSVVSSSSSSNVGTTSTLLASSSPASSSATSTTSSSSFSSSTVNASAGSTAGPVDPGTSSNLNASGGLEGADATKTTTIAAAAAGSVAALFLIASGIGAFLWRRKQRLAKRSSRASTINAIKMNTTVYSDYVSSTSYSMMRLMATDPTNILSKTAMLNGMTFSHATEPIAAADATAMTANAPTAVTQRQVTGNTLFTLPLARYTAMTEPTRLLAETTSLTQETVPSTSTDMTTPLLQEMPSSV